jgi:hypothetical protein
MFNNELFSHLMIDDDDEINESIPFYDDNADKKAQVVPERAPVEDNSCSSLLSESNSSDIDSCDTQPLEEYPEASTRDAVLQLCAYSFLAGVIGCYMFYRNDILSYFNDYRNSNIQINQYEYPSIFGLQSRNVVEEIQPWSERLPFTTIALYVIGCICCYDAIRYSLNLSKASTIGDQNEDTQIENQQE